MAGGKQKPAPDAATLLKELIPSRNAREVAESPCYRGSEIYSWRARVRESDEVFVDLHFCGGYAASVLCVIDLERAPQAQCFAEVAITDAGVRVPVPRLSTGWWGLRWDFFTNVDEWLLASELVVNNVVIFRHYKHHASTTPNSYFYELEVIR